MVGYMRQREGPRVEEKGKATRVSGVQDILMENQNSDLPSQGKDAAAPNCAFDQCRGPLAWEESQI